MTQTLVFSHSLKLCIKLRPTPTNTWARKNQTKSHLVTEEGSRPAVVLFAHRPVRIEVRLLFQEVLGRLVPANLHLFQLQILPFVHCGRSHETVERKNQSITKKKWVIAPEEITFSYEVLTNFLPFIINSGAENKKIDPNSKTKGTTNLRWTPSPRCLPEHSRQIQIP